MALNLSTANKSQGLEVIPGGTLVTLAMKLRAGTVGVEGLCKRSSKGDSEGVDLEYTVKGGDYDGRKLYALPDGNGRYRDKNVIGKILRVGDKGYRRLDQPPPMPIERLAPPATTAGGSGGTPAPTPIERPHWGQ